jgi:hypothetical protein
MGTRLATRGEATEISVIFQKQKGTLRVIVVCLLQSGDWHWLCSLGPAVGNRQ